MVTMVTKKAKNEIFARKTIGATHLKLGMQYNFTLGVTWAGSHLATPFTFPV